MEEIKLKIDWYTKAVLTVIALTLCWMCVKPLFSAKEVMANPDADTLYGSVYYDVKYAISHAEPIRVEVDNWP